MIKKMRITNFKSFKNLEIELGNFNVLIGANASGKSNFIQIFHFLKDTIEFGLENAISLQGGIEYLRNINIGLSDNFSVTIFLDDKFGLIGNMTDEGGIGIRIYETTYEFALRFKKGGLGFEIVKDNLTQKCNFMRLERKKNKIQEKESMGEGEIIISHADRTVKMHLKKPDVVTIKEGDIFPPFFTDMKLPPHSLLIESPFLHISPVMKILGEIAIYDFDPKLPKKATPITGKAELEEDGSNLSIVLKNIIGKGDKKKKLLNLISDILPFIDLIDVEKFADKSLLFKLREKYFKKQYLPASLLSDGTINITALIIALFFEKEPLSIIEEPERNIHPHLISKIAEMMKDASQKKQIIVTSHNPEIVKHADLENILLIARSKEGFSTISRPAGKEEVKTFLKNEIGIEELFVQGLLEV